MDELIEQVTARGRGGRENVELVTLTTDSEALAQAIHFGRRLMRVVPKVCQCS